jgi:thiamine biosynthesis protein ThiS
MINIVVNGAERTIEENLSLSSLLEKLNLPVMRVAVELNQTVVRRATWAETQLKENDKIEIVHFVGGG